jgi:hypothetical protein
VRQHFLRIPPRFCHPADNPHSGPYRAGTNDLRAPVRRPVRSNSATASEQVRIGAAKNGPNGSRADVCPSVNKCHRPPRKANLGIIIRLTFVPPIWYNQALREDLKYCLTGGVMRMVWGVLPQASPSANGEGKGLYYGFLRTCSYGRSLGAFFLSRIGQAKPL